MSKPADRDWEGFDRVVRHAVTLGLALPGNVFAGRMTIEATVPRTGESDRDGTRLAKSLDAPDLAWRVHVGDGAGMDSGGAQPSDAVKNAMAIGIAHAREAHNDAAQLTDKLAKALREVEEMG